MSGLDLDATIRRSIATLLHASYTDHEPTETTDVWRTIAADAACALNALITRLRAAEAALPSADEVYAIEEARSAIESSCDVYCDEIDAWLSRVGEARSARQPAPPTGGDHG